jgi:hypothetical protein
MYKFITIEMKKRNKFSILALGILGAILMNGESVMLFIEMNKIPEGSFTDKKEFTTHFIPLFLKFLTSMISLPISVLALVTSIAGGITKSKNRILIFGISNIIIGILSVYFSNWIPGCLLIIAGLLGVAISKEGTNKDVPLLSSIFFYLWMIFILIFTTVFVIADRSGLLKFNEIEIQEKLLKRSK